MSFFRRKANTSENFMGIPSQAMDGYIFSIKNVLEDSLVECSPDCINIQYYTKRGKTECFDCSIPIINGRYSAIVVCVNIVATDCSSGNWKVDGGDVKIIDNEGFVYDGSILCDVLSSNKGHAKRNDAIPIRTQANITYVFPPLPLGRILSTILIINGSSTLRFSIRESPKEEDVFSSDYYYSIIPDSDYHRRKDPDRLKITKAVLGERLLKFTELVKARLYSPVFTDEAEKMEKEIEELNNKISLELVPLTYVDDSSLSELKENYYTVAELYRLELMNNPPREKSFHYNVKHVEDLQNLPPYQFEHFCATLIKNFGFTDVAVTPQSNDKGVDIFAKKDGEVYVVQCKRYKGTVGSPEIQQFIGAMVSSHATKGIFITTGWFTRAAIKIANGQPITLIDGDRLSSYL